MNKNSQVTFRVNQSLIDSFNIRYPHSRSLFLRRCLEKALNDKSFFDFVYFGVVDFSLKTSFKDERLFDDSLVQGV